MRTTLTIDEALYRELRRRAASSGRPLKAVVNEALMRGLDQRQPARGFRQRTVSLGGPVEGIDLRKALSLATDLEDAESAHELGRGR